MHIIFSKNYLQIFCEYITRYYEKHNHLIKYSFFWSAIMFFSANLMASANIAYSNDGLLSFNHADATFTDVGYNWTTSLGRFISPIYWWLRGTICPPWLVGVLSFTYLAISVYLVVILFGIRRPAPIMLVAGFMCTNATVTCLLSSFGGFSDTYLLALLFSIIGVTVSSKSNKFGIVLAAIPYVLTLGLYQVYIVFSIGIIASIFILDILSNSTRNSLRRLFGNLISIALAAVIYLIFYNLVLLFMGIKAPTSSNSLTSLMDFSEASSLLPLVLETYCMPLKGLLSPISVHYKVGGLINLLLIILLFVLLFWRSRANRVSAVNTILAFCSTLFLPFLLNLVFFLSKGKEFGELLQYPWMIFYLLLIGLMFSTGSLQDTKKHLTETLPPPAIASSNCKLVQKITSAPTSNSKRQAFYWQ